MNVLNGIEKIKVGQVWRLKNRNSVRILATDKIPQKDADPKFIIVGLQLTGNGEVLGHWSITGEHESLSEELGFIKIAQAWDNLEIDEPCHAAIETKIGKTDKVPGYYHYAGLSDDDRPMVFVEGRCSWNSTGKALAVNCRPLNEEENERVENGYTAAHKQ